VKISGRLKDNRLSKMIVLHLEDGTDYLRSLPLIIIINLLTVNLKHVLDLVLDLWLLKVGVGFEGHVCHLLGEVKVKAVGLEGVGVHGFLHEAQVRAALP
jgi:hypothetical protein